VRILGWTAATAVSLAIVVNYGVAMKNGGFPSGHPWSGISLTSLVVGNVYFGRRNRTEPLLMVSFFAACSLLSAGLWSVSMHAH
jgi:hypothetical protein